MHLLANALRRRVLWENDFRACEEEWTPDEPEQTSVARLGKGFQTAWMLILQLFAPCHSLKGLKEVIGIKDGKITHIFP